jgi:hypothetical protein
VLAIPLSRVGGGSACYVRHHHAMKNIIIVLCLVLAISATWLFLRRSAPSVPRDISISFLGLTNDTDIESAAMFSLTNGGDFPVHYSVRSLDFKTPNGWTATDPGASSRFGDDIKPGKVSMVWRIPVPKSGYVWRLTLSCAEEVKNPDGKWQDSGRQYSIVSSEITP